MSPANTKRVHNILTLETHFGNGNGIAFAGSFAKDLDLMTYCHSKASTVPRRCYRWQYLMIKLLLLQHRLTNPSDGEEVIATVAPYTTTMFGLKTGKKLLVPQKSSYFRLPLQVNRKST